MASNKPPGSGFANSPGDSSTLAFTGQRPTPLFNIPLQALSIFSSMWMTSSSSDHPNLKFIILLLHSRPIFDSKTLVMHLDSLALNLNNRDGFTLTQTQYTLSILHMLKIEHCKPLPTTSPMTCATSSSGTLDNSPLYRRIVGALQYLNFTRPDICYVVNQACRSIHSPQVAD